MVSNVVLECKDLIKIYETMNKKIKFPALRGLDLTIKENDLSAIIGPSGAGKTTLLNILGMLDLPSSGEIVLHSNEFGQINYSKLSIKKLTSLRRQLFGYLFQIPDQNYHRHISVWRNITFKMKLLSKYTREERIKRTTELLKMVKLENRKHHKPSQLSGGEAQRLGICLALANDPLIVLADEPTGELDSLNTFSIINYFRELNRDLGKIFIVTTHDYRFATMTNRTYKIQDGKIISLFKTDKFQKDFHKQEEYVYISDDGTMKIPEKCQKRYKIKRIAKIKYEEDHFKVYRSELEE